MGEGDSAVRVLAVFATIIELLAAVVGLFLCVVCSVHNAYPHTQPPSEDQGAETAGRRPI